MTICYGLFGSKQWHKMSSFKMKDTFAFFETVYMSQEI